MFSMAIAETMPTRIDLELFEAARAKGARASRSAAQQLAHWARIGRAIESAPEINQRRIESVLAGQMAYDALPAEEQSVVRAAWDQRIANRIATLDLVPLLASQPGGFVESDASGNLVEHFPR